MSELCLIGIPSRYIESTWADAQQRGTLNDFIRFAACASFSPKLQRWKASPCSLAFWISDQTNIHRDKRCAALTSEDGQRSRCSTIAAHKRACRSHLGLCRCYCCEPLSFLQHRYECSSCSWWISLFTWISQKGSFVIFHNVIITFSFLSK